MTKKLLKQISTLFFAALFVFATMLPAFAAFGESLPLFTTVNGIRYEIVSLIHNETRNSITYQLSVYVCDNKTVPTGTIGCQAKLYSTDGNFSVVTEWDYNPGSNDASYLNSDQHNATSGFYYSQGNAKLFNGFNYVPFTSNRATNFAPGRNTVPTKLEDIQIQRNENGEIYGSELFLSEIGVQPDLIRSVGIDGTIGYVRAEDLDDGVRTPADAIIAMQNRQSRLIPLYESDGITVIGSFKISA